MEAGTEGVGANGKKSRVIASMRGIVKIYGTRTILDHVDLDVYAGEKVALIGPSGSGKTTILRLMIGLMPPEEGTIEIEGEYLWHTKKPDGTLVPAGESHARKVRRSLGMVFQQFNLFPHMTALQNVQEPAQMALGLSKEE
ncbi:MAG: ATP-binding cassette domain-containing protein, partial [Dehalococcoidia bacterium]